MLFLGKKEKIKWEYLFDLIDRNEITPKFVLKKINQDLQPIFCFYVGTKLAAKKNINKAKKWFLYGKKIESLPTNLYFLDFIKRYNNKLTIPKPAFEDPKPFILFSNSVVIKSSRNKFISHSCSSLPFYKKSINILDVGCGNGTLLISLIKKLQKNKKIPDINKIILIDPSKRMLNIATKNIYNNLPNVKIVTICEKIEDASNKIKDKVDITILALSFHHLPYENKLAHLKKLARKSNNFLLFEVSADNDTPQLFSPELATSVYQSYGSVIKFVLAVKSSKKIAKKSIDYFLMTEAISLLTQPRGKRTEYHMLKTQWHQLFRKALSKSFSCISSSTCYKNKDIEFLSIHYGKKYYNNS